MKKYNYMDTAYVINRYNEPQEIIISSITVNPRGAVTYNGFEAYQLYATKEECLKDIERFKCSKSTPY